jgi:hypothetical protein
MVKWQATESLSVGCWPAAAPQWRAAPRTVGYGDIISISAEARLVAVFESVAGVFLLAFLVARLVALSRGEEDYRHPARTQAGIPQVPNIPQEQRRCVSRRTC